MEIHPLVFISSIVVPLFIVSLVMTWALFLRKKNIANRDALLKEKQDASQQRAENKLWESLVSDKEKHISVLQEKLNKNDH